VKNYRSYDISQLGGSFVAQSSDGEDDTALVSMNINRIYQAIDQLWTTLEKGKRPAWFVGTSIDLDSVAAECFPSDTDPPWGGTNIIGLIKFITVIFVTATPIAYLIHRFMVHSEPAVIFTLAVCAVAVCCGTVPALLLSLLSAAAYNLVVVPPELQFTIPETYEVFYIVINVVISIGLPMLIRFQLKKPDWQD
jgi:hypothetical protein